MKEISFLYLAPKSGILWIDRWLVRPFRPDLSILTCKHTNDGESLGLMGRKATVWWYDEVSL